METLGPETSLDKWQLETIWLHIMSNRTATYPPGPAFRALADPTRRAVLDLLRRGSLPAGRIAASFPVSRPAISKHLRLLRHARLVRERREGRRRLYQLNPEPLRAVDAWLDQYRMFWRMNLADLKAFVEAEHAKEQSVRRKRLKKN
jgi:DNA-binding transcriptional ArsR family regulator